jgi:hypothetical protein
MTDPAFNWFRAQLADREVTPRRILRRIDSRYMIPDGLEVERVVSEVREPNNDGGTGWHYEYVCVCREVQA